MREPKEQAEGLQAVINLLPRCPGLELGIEPNGKLLFLRRGRYEIVYVTGGYDLWGARGGGLLEPDLTAEEAAEELLTRGRRRRT